MKTLSKFSFGIALVFGVMVGCVSAYGQEQQTAKETAFTAKFGIKGGVNFANLYINDVHDENVKIGVNAGFFAKLPVVKGLSIQPELLWSSKGAKATYNNALQGNGEYRFNLNYIESPLTMILNITPNFNISAGGYVAYLVSANVKNMQSDGSISGVRDLNADNFHRFDYGLVGGVGVDVGNVTLGARYNYGLQQVGKSGTTSGELTRDSKNSVATLYLGFAF